MYYWKHSVTSLIILLYVVLLVCLPINSVAADSPIVVTVDNDDSVTRVGYWAPSSGANPYGSGSEYSVTGQFIWNADLPVSGEYSVEAYWTSYSNRTSQASYTINQQIEIDDVMVNQRAGGGAWVKLGQYQFSEGVASVELSNASTGTLSADAIRFTQVSDVVVVPGTDDVIVVDNLDSNVYRSGYWAVSSGALPYEGGSEYSKTGEFTWSPHVPVAGQYDVQVRWTQHPSRTGKAQYLIEHAQGETAATLNQKLDGGDWVSLGTYHFDRAYPNITVKNTGGYGTLSADAIRLVKFDGPVTTSGDVNDDASISAFLNMSRWVIFYTNDEGVEKFMALNPVGSYGYRQPLVKLIGKDKLLLTWSEVYCLNLGIYADIDNGCYDDNSIIDSQAKVRMLDFSNGAYADIPNLWVLDVLPIGSWAHDFSLWKYNVPPYDNFFYANAGDIVDLRLFDDASSFVKYNKSGEFNVEYIRHYSATGESSQEIELTMP